MGNEITVKMKENMPVVALLEQSGLIGQKKAGSDLHIPASVWNSFAAEIGKAPVKNYITDKNAEISVRAPGYRGDHNRYVAEDPGKCR